LVEIGKAVTRGKYSWRTGSTGLRATERDSDRPGDPKRAGKQKVKENAPGVIGKRAQGKTPTRSVAWEDYAKSFQSSTPESEQEKKLSQIQRGSGETPAVENGNGAQLGLVKSQEGRGTTHFVDRREKRDLSADQIKRGER